MILKYNVHDGCIITNQHIKNKHLSKYSCFSFVKYIYIQQVSTSTH